MGRAPVSCGDFSHIVEAIAEKLLAEMTTKLAAFFEVVVSGPISYRL